MTSRMVKIGDFARVISGATPKTGIDEYWDGNIFWATPKDLSKFEGKYIGSTIDKITEAGCKSCSTVILPPNSVLLSSRAPIGHLAINSVPMATNQGFKSLILDPSLADSSYVFYWLRSNREFLNSLGRGATFKEISKSIVQEIEIPLPPLEVQKRIASILDAADALRAKRRESLRKLEVLLKSVFLEMFGDPVTNPKGWEVRPLESYLTFLTSGSRGWAEYYSTSGTIFLRIQNVGKNELLLEDLSFVNAPESAEKKRTTVRPGDVLVSITADLGRTAAIPDGFPTANISQHLGLLRTTGIVPEYLSAFLSSSGGQAQFQRLNRGGVKAGLNFDDLKSLFIPNPPFDLQLAHKARQAQIRQSIVKLESSLTSLENLFSSLQHQAFNGTFDSAAPQLAQLEVQTSLF